MDKERENTSVPERTKRRPSRLVFLAAALYHGLLAIIFLTGFVLTLFNHPVTQKYIQLYELAQIKLILLSGATSLCFTGQITGIIKLWQSKIIGIYIYIISFVLILSLQLWIQSINWINFAISSFFLILLILQSKKILRQKKVKL